ncbi:hypothetical protein ACS0TY_013013 [Phlomoides rotata]
MDMQPHPEATLSNSTKIGVVQTCVLFFRSLRISPRILFVFPISPSSRLTGGKRKDIFNPIVCFSRSYNIVRKTDKKFQDLKQGLSFMLFSLK